MRTRAEERYHNDPVFHTLVDVLYNMLESDEAKNYTPTELREAVILAASMYEYRHIRPIVMRRENLGAVPPEIHFEREARKL